MLLLLSFLGAAAAAAPTQLVADLKPSPSLGVALAPTLRWASGSCAGAKDTVQASYEITVSDEASGAEVWSTGSVSRRAERK